ncbi:MAG: DUF3352 domain-containing protein [Bacteroidota bacterium]
MSIKWIFRGILLLLLLYLGYLLYIFVLSPKANLQPIYLVPKDAVFLIETDTPVESWQKISESATWEHLKKNSRFSELTESIQMMDTVFNNRRKLFQHFDGRSLLISIHMISPDDYGLFYVLDLKRIAKLKLIKQYLNTLLNENYILSKRDYKGHEILEVFDRKNKETLHLAFIKNQLVASYTHTLVEASLDQHQEPVIGRNLDFIKINKKVGYEDLFRLYVQYDYLDNYLAQYTDGPNAWLDRISNNLLFSGFSMDFEEELITANGFTNISLNNETYLRALQQSGTAKRQVPKVAPKGTALYVSYGFDSFKDFYENFENIKKESPESFETYDKGIRAVEKLLKIDIQDHFIDWIGDELGFLRVDDHIDGLASDIALVLTTNDISEAKEDLGFVLQQIKKRTPVKFRSVNYKGYDIHYLAIKGFFKMLFGNRFNALDKPYFTFVDDFVVFSNDPNTLKSIINDFEEGTTLASAEEFKRFDNHFEAASSLYVYGNVPLVFDAVYGMVDAATKRDMRKNKDFFICFPQVGLQLTPKDHLFESLLVAQYQDVTSVKDNPYYKIQKAEVPAKFKTTTRQSELTEAVFNLRPIYPPDLNATLYERKYTNGQVKLRVRLKNGQKEGRYEAFYPSGEKRMTGRFKKDQQVGTWRYFDTEGTLVLKKRF